MKITDVRCHVMCPIQDDLGGPRSRTFVEIDTDEGITGLGEATTEFHEMAVKTQIEVELTGPEEPLLVLKPVTVYIISFEQALRELC